MTDELYENDDSMGHASLSTIGTLESLHTSFNSSFQTINSLDALNDSIASMGFGASKSVRFAPSTSKRQCISRYDMTLEEAQRTWILAEEKSNMMKQHCSDVQRAKAGVKDEEGCGFRGLESLHDEQAEGIRSIISSCVHAVIQEQKKLWGSKHVDPSMQIALVSARHSGRSRKAALNRAESDLKEAKQLREKTDEALFFQELFASQTVVAEQPPPPPQPQNKRPPPMLKPQKAATFARPSSSNHLGKYTSLQSTRVMMRGGLRWDYHFHLLFLLLLILIGPTYGISYFHTGVHHFAFLR